MADRKEPDRRVALVTGASRGIGRSGAVALARRGFDVVITARTVREGEGRARPSSSKAPEISAPIAGSLETTAAEIEALGRSCLAIPMDLMDRQSIHQVADEVLGQWGRVDVLFNNAIYQGPGTMDRVLDLPLELAERCLVGDYLHPLLLIQLLLPQMLERGEGRLVNMLSEAAFTTPPAPAGEGGWGLAYAAAKAAFHRVTDMCHVEFFDAGVWSFSIAPGLTLTESMRASGTDKVLIDAGYPPAPPEVAGEVAAWLADDAGGEGVRRADGLLAPAVQEARPRGGMAAAEALGTTSRRRHIRHGRPVARRRSVPERTAGRHGALRWRGPSPRRPRRRGPAQDDDQGDADQLGVAELDPGRDAAAVVVEHPDARRFQLGGERVAASNGSSPLPVATRWTSAGATDRRPAQPEVVEGLLGHRRHGPRDADAVGAHGDRDRLAVRAEHVQPERVGVLAAQLEDVPELDASRQPQRRRRTAGRDRRRGSRPRRSHRRGRSHGPARRRRRAARLGWRRSPTPSPRRPAGRPGSGCRATPAAAARCSP